MNLFGVKIETAISALEYSADEEFVYKELDSLQKNDNKRINLSVLLNLKVDKIEPSFDVLLYLVYLGKEKAISVEETGQTVQVAKRLKLWQSTLANLFEELSAEDHKRIIWNDLLSDPWEFRRTIKLNILDIPVLDCGTYAVTFYAARDNNLEDLKLLDCSYFDVI